MTFYVYGLCEPTGEIRYVGKSRNPTRRLAGHLANPSDPMRAWLASLSEPPAIKTMARFESEDGALAEERRIIAALSIGGRLLNIVHTDRPRVELVEFAGIGERLRRRRKELGINGSTLSRISGVSQPSISQLETGRNTDIAGSSLVRIARALETTAEWLMTGEAPNA